MPYPEPERNLTCLVREFRRLKSAPSTTIFEFLHLQPTKSSDILENEASRLLSTLYRAVRSPPFFPNLANLTQGHEKSTYEAMKRLRGKSGLSDKNPVGASHH